MKKALKWIGIVLGSLVVLAVLAAVGLSLVGGAKLKKKRNIQAEKIPIPNDDASLARGKFLVTTICTSCHGADLSGKVLFDQPGLVTVYSANITGLSQTHSDADLVRAIRHSVGQDGRQFVSMPAEIFINFSAEDLGSVIAYLKTVPRVGQERPKPRLSFLARIMLSTGGVGQIFPAEYIDHHKPFPKMPSIGASVEYGAYMGGWCTACHGPDLTGAQPVFDPAAPFAPNLTQGGELRGWSEEDFLKALHTGMTPSGHQLDSNFMPWDVFGKFDDDQLKGLWLYLHSLPAANVTK